VSAQPGNDGRKVFRYAFPVPRQGSIRRRFGSIFAHLGRNIFDAPLTYDFLARPAKLRPNVAVAMPEVTDDYRTYTIRLKPGIFFQDDPAFKGQKRELVAADFVYAWKRIYDPRWKSPSYAGLAPSEILGARTCARKR